MLKRVVLGIGAIVLCAEFSGQKTSSDFDPKPEINVFGSVLAANGERSDLENIAVVPNKINRIPVYQMPRYHDDTGYEVLSDETDLSFLDVCKIETIMEPHGQKNIMVPKVSTINKRKYVHIVVYFSDGTKQEYIIENRRRIEADDLNAGGSRRKMSFSAIQALYIAGDKPQDPEQTGTNYRKCPHVTVPAQVPVAKPVPVAHKAPKKISTELVNLRKEIANYYT